MPRARMIKPEFWTDEKTGILNSDLKCLFLGLLNFADDEGLARANPAYLKSMVFPYDSTVDFDTINDWVECLENEQLIYVYHRNNQAYIWITKFRVHQRIDRPGRPQNPPPDRRDPEFHLALFHRDSFICSKCGEHCDLGDDPNGEDSIFPIVVYPIEGNKVIHYPSFLKTFCKKCLDKSSDHIKLFDDHSTNVRRTLDESSQNDQRLKQKEVKLKKQPNKVTSIYITTSENPTGSETDGSADADRSPSVSKKSIKSQHYSGKVGDYLDRIEKACSTIVSFPQKSGKAFNPYEAVTAATNRNGHPKAIAESIESLANPQQWKETEKPWSWFNAVFKTKNGKYNEAEEIAQSKAHKNNKKSDAALWATIWKKAVNERGRA